jgi:hypothetical protein
MGLLQKVSINFLLIGDVSMPTRTIVTTQQATAFVEELYRAWRDVYHNYDVKSRDFRLKEFDRFIEKYYTDFDSFKNYADERGRYLFEQLSPNHKQQFKEIIIQYNVREQQINVYRRGLDKIKLQQQIEALEREGVFANKPKPTAEDIEKQWLSSYGGNIVVTRGASAQ